MRVKTIQIGSVSGYFPALQAFDLARMVNKLVLKCSNLQGAVSTWRALYTMGTHIAVNDA